MIGGYVGSSGADQALKRVVEAMVMPAGVDVRLDWPVFGSADRKDLLIAYSRRDTGYQSGQQNQDLGVTGIVFDIYIWSQNENAVQSIMDHLEAGFSAYPLRNGLQATRAYLTRLPGMGAVPLEAQMIVDTLDSLLAPNMGTVSVAKQEKELAAVNSELSKLADIAKPADWGTILDSLTEIQGRLRQAPPYSFRRVNCRDLTAPEVWQLGLAGRVFSVDTEFSTSAP